MGNIINAPIALSTKAFISKYSRGHEKDADTYGIQLAASAGYHPDALATALERLAKGIELTTGKTEKKNYFSDHPYTPSRITNIRNLAPNFKPVNPKPVTSSIEVFFKNFNGLCYGPNPEQGVFNDSLFIQPDIGFSWIVPSGWGTVNKPVGVGAYTSKGDAIITLSIADSTKAVHDIGEEVKNKATKSQGIMVLFAGDTTVNSHEAYLIRLKGVYKREEVFLELIWLKFEQNVFQLAGAFTPMNKTSAHHALCSFRKSTPEELKSVSLLELHFVQAKKSETLGELSDRTDNELTIPLTSLINDMDQKNVLNENEMVKIIKDVPYEPKAK
ncbi:MAG TPA: M48 family metalloprotease [Cyclobacteriaceae bacterium]|nr:M48 family metalloprotease [Cyclobacteriaceae bacterium]